MVQFKGAIVNPHSEEDIGFYEEQKIRDNLPSYYCEDFAYEELGRRLSYNHEPKLPDYVEIDFPISHDTVKEILSSMGIDNDEFIVDVFDCSVDFYLPETNNPWTIIEFANEAADYYKGLDIEEDMLMAIMKYFDNKECTKSFYVFENHAYKIVEKPENEKSIPYKGKYIQLYYEDWQ